MNESKPAHAFVHEYNYKKSLLGTAFTLKASNSPLHNSCYPVWKCWKYNTNTYLYSAFSCVTQSAVTQNNWNTINERNVQLLNSWEIIESHFYINT